MFDIGMQEIIVIIIVALLVFGPKRLPELSRTIGKGLSELRRAVEDAKYQVDRELKEEEERLKEGLPDIKTEIHSEEGPYHINDILKVEDKNSLHKDEVEENDRRT